MVILQEFHLNLECILLGKVANREMDTVRVHVPFPVTHVTQMKQQFGWYSENPSQFIEGFQQFSIMTFDSTWQARCII